MKKRATGLPGSVTECLEIGLSKINSKHTLLITDACFRTPLFHARSVPSDAMVAVNKLNEMTGKKAITSGMLSNVQGDFFSYLSDKLEKNTQKYLPFLKSYSTVFSKTVSITLI